MDKRKTKTGIRKRPDLKTLLFGGNTPVTVPGSRFPNGTQSLVPVADIRNGVILTTDGRYIKLLEVLPTNFYLQSELEQRNCIYYLAGYLRIAPASLQILVTTQRADIDTYCEQMERFYDAETNEKCRTMIWEDAELVNYLAANEAVTRHFYLAFAYTGNATEFEEIVRELDDLAETAGQYLDYCGLEVLRHENPDETLFRTLYSLYHKAAADAEDKTAFAGIGTVHGADAIPTNELSEEAQIGQLTVQDSLAPTVCDLTGSTYVVIDGVYHTYLYVAGYGYPTENGRAWLSPLVELGDGISLSFYHKWRSCH